MNVSQRDHLVIAASLMFIIADVKTTRSLNTFVVVCCKHWTRITEAACPLRHDFLRSGICFIVSYYLIPPCDGFHRPVEECFAVLLRNVRHLSCCSTVIWPFGNSLCSQIINSPNSLLYYTPISNFGRRHAIRLIASLISTCPLLYFLTSP